MYFYVKAMKRLPDDKGAVIMGFIALAALAWQNPEGIKEIAESVDFVDRLLVSLKVYDDLGS